MFVPCDHHLIGHVRGMRTSSNLTKSGGLQPEWLTITVPRAGTASFHAVLGGGFCPTFAEAYAHPDEHPRSFILSTACSDAESVPQHIYHGQLLRNMTIGSCCASRLSLATNRYGTDMTPTNRAADVVQPFVPIGKTSSLFSSLPGHRKQPSSVRCNCSVA